MLDAIAAQLVAMRAQIDAMYAVVQAARELEPPPLPSGCPHAETEEIGTFGKPEKRCVACGEVVKL